MSDNKTEEKKYYSVFSIDVKRPALIRYLRDGADASRNLSNAALYILRNIETGLKKPYSERHENCNKVIEKVFKMIELYNKKCSKNLILNETFRSVSYGFLDFYFKTSKDENYYCQGYPIHASQQDLKAVIRSMKAYKEAEREYFRNPLKFNGKPSLPGYKSPDFLNTFTLTNQVCKIKNNELHFPKTKLTLKCKNHPKGRLKEVKVVPHHGIFTVFMYFERTVKKPSSGLKSIGVDLGVENLISAVTDSNKSLIVKGSILNSFNKKYNKLFDDNKSKRTIGTDVKLKSSRLSDSLYKNRMNFIKDYLHKTANFFIDYCIEHEVSTVYIGRNEGWKKNVNMGRKNNRALCEIPHSLLINYITYKAERQGIKTVLQEESYTSQASAPDSDIIPVYAKNSNVCHKFSGKRIHRGLYRYSKGIINSDLNGALNILRKGMKATPLIENFSCLNNPYMVRNIFNYTQKAL